MWTVCKERNLIISRSGLLLIIFITKNYYASWYVDYLEIYAVVISENVWWHGVSLMVRNIYIHFFADYKVLVEDGNYEKAV